MWGCSSRALVRASRTNRSASPGEGVSPRSSTFTATSCPSVSSRTRNTAANPPSPKTSPTVNFLPRAFWRRRRSVVRSSDMADAKPRNLRRVALGTAGVVFVWLFALRLELALSKDRILELYLNIAEWGPGIWGVDAASRAYFAVPAARLTAEQAAELAATLPHPRTSNPTFRPDRTLARRNLILARYRGVDVYIPPEEEMDTVLVVPPVIVPPTDTLNVQLPLPVDTLVDTTTSQTDSL